VLREREALVVADTMVRRQEPGEHRGVRGQGERTVAVHVLEDDALAAQRVELRGAALGVPVDAEAVRPQGVGRDQHDRSGPGGGGGGGRAGGGGGGGGRRGGAPHPPPAFPPAWAPSSASQPLTRGMSRASPAAGAWRR